MISWKEHYNIGIGEVDRQHQELAVKLNEFLNACVNRNGIEKIMETLSILKDATVEHFETEERIMADFQFPDYEGHKKDHDDFVATVLELEKTIQNQGPAVISSLKLNRTLADWLVTHISKSDVKIGEFLKAKNLL